jgi:site-specific recombinase XerD
VDVLRVHRKAQLQSRVAAGERWAGLDLVFTTRLGSPLDAANVRRAFRRVAATAGLDPAAWTPRELRHSFVSLLSSTGVSIEDISHLVGHANTPVTESVYRKELRPVLTRAPGLWTPCSPSQRPRLGKQIGKQGSRAHVSESNTTAVISV